MLQSSVPRHAVVALFCGIGGSTHGFHLEGLNVVAGYDIDPTCRYAFEANNNAAFKCADISEVSSQELGEWYPSNSVKILVGCAPCQPFSSYNFKNEDTKKWFLLEQFARLIEDIRPEVVPMENVHQVLDFTKAAVFTDFVATLKRLGYHTHFSVVDSPKYGLPQKRKRLVPLASLLGEISLIPETHTRERFVTVEKTIGHLPRIRHRMGCHKAWQKS